MRHITRSEERLINKKLHSTVENFKPVRMESSIFNQTFSEFFNETSTKEIEEKVKEITIRLKEWKFNGSQKGEEIIYGVGVDLHIFISYLFDLNKELSISVIKLLIVS